MNDRGRVVLLAGGKFVGKSWLALSVCLSATTLGDVLYLALQDDESRLQRRLAKLLETETASVDLRRLNFQTGCPRVSDEGLLSVEVWLELNPRARLVVVDPLVAIQDSGRNGARAAIAGLRELATRFQVAFLVVTFPRKVAELAKVAGATDGALTLGRKLTPDTLTEADKRGLLALLFGPRASPLKPSNPSKLGTVEEHGSTPEEEST